MHLKLIFFLINIYFQVKKGLGHNNQQSQIRHLWSWNFTSRSKFNIRRRGPIPDQATFRVQITFSLQENIKSMATVFEVTECFGTYIWIFFSEIVFIMQVADRPGDISILTHIFVSDNRTVVLYLGAACSWK